MTVDNLLLIRFLTCELIHKFKGGTYSIIQNHIVLKAFQLKLSSFNMVNKTEFVPTLTLVSAVEIRVVLA
jgi:hypothetical protein